MFIDWQSQSYNMTLKIPTNLDILYLFMMMELSLLLFYLYTKYMVDCECECSNGVLNSFLLFIDNSLLFLWISIKNIYLSK